MLAGAVAAALGAATLGGVGSGAGPRPPTRSDALLTATAASSEALASLPPSPLRPSAPAGRAPGAAGRVRGGAGAAPAGLPAPTASLPSLPAPGPLREVDAVVTLPAPVTSSEVDRLVHTPGLAAIEEVDTGTVTLAGSPAVTFGVDPGTFRDFTPVSTSRDTKLWQYIAAGALASSYEMATDRKLPLGTRLPLIPAGQGRGVTSGWVGAFAAIGIPGVDMVVSRAYSHALGLVPDSGLVISAPGLDQHALDQDLSQDLPGADVEVTDQRVAVAPSAGAPSAGALAGPSTMASVVAAALSRVGSPYVWGGDGPNQFDCSGLVGWAFAQAGISMPRTAAQQYLAGPHVPMSQLQPGDLLFWAYDPADPGFVDHVAMYIGHHRMVVAPHTGTDVQVDRVPTADLVGATRVDPAMAAQVGGPRFP